MKKLVVTLLVLLSFVAQADELVLVKLSEVSQQKTLIESASIHVHYFNNQFVIGTIPASETIELPFTVLTENAWQTDHSYYVVYVPSDLRSDYLSCVANQIKLLHTDENFIVVEANEKEYGPLIPAKSDGMVRLFNTSAKLPKRHEIFDRTIVFDPFVESLLEEVSADNITTMVQHLQDYGTRNTFHSSAVLAEDWIAEQFENLGLEVERQSFNAGYNGASLAKNVIAVKTGTKYPDEYVVVGGHFDSANWYDGDEAPGADDNASGVAGVLEIARILSEHEFDRTIIFCAFAGEEHGLYGSSAYAQRCAQQGMDIIGYFNLDMTGYLEPENDIYITLMYPFLATDLADFYRDVCAIYLSDLEIRTKEENLSSSDYESFNQNGYMGIHSGECDIYGNPYFHTSQDIIGLSYNNEEQAKIFTQVSLANVVIMADELKNPRNLVATAGDGFVDLIWDALDDVEGYNIYRNDVIIETNQTNSYTDNSVVNQTIYKYYVTALYGNELTESRKSNSVQVIPMPPLSLPLFINFELGEDLYWTFEGNWGLTEAQSYSNPYSLTDSPDSAYENNVEASAILDTFDLSDHTIKAASFSFYTKYYLESNADYVYVEISKDNGIIWEQIDTFTGLQDSWKQKIYSLDPYLGESELQIRFRIKTNESIRRDGIYIDDLHIDINTVGITTHEMETNLYPNPVNNILTIEFPTQETIQLMLTDSKGAILKIGTAQTKAQLDLSGLPSGTYFLNYTIAEKKITKKIVLK